MAENKIKITYATRAVEKTDEQGNKSIEYLKIHPITTGNAVVVKDKEGNLKTLNKALEDVSSPPEIYIGENPPTDLETLWINPNGVVGTEGSDVPNDDKSYVRKNKQWAELDAYTKLEADTKYQLKGNYLTDLDILGKVDKIEGSSLVPNTKVESYDNHIADKNNPHEVTKELVGLGNVDNTADKDKEVKLADNIKGSSKANLILVSNGDGTTSWVDFNSINLLAYGIKWSTSNTGLPVRVGNSLLHKELPIQSAFRGCVAKGKTILYYLNPSNWAQKADGTPSNLTGVDGDVCIHTPKFYGRSFIEGDLRSVYISTTQIDGTWIEIPEMLIDAYRGTVHDSKLVSVCNTSAEYRGGGNRSEYDTYLSTDPVRSDLGKPRTNITRATMRTYAKNAGKALLCYEYYKWIFYWCYSIEYCSFHSLAGYNASLTSEGYHLGGLGASVSNVSNWPAFNNYYPITPCGYTNEFGNFSGVKVLSSGALLPLGEVYANRWRGFEVPFGDIWTNLDGVIILGYADSDGVYRYKNVYTSTDINNFADSINDTYKIVGKEVHNDGNYSNFDLRETAEIIPSDTSGGRMNDYHWTGSKDSSLRTLLVGGGADNGSNAGFGFFTSDTGVGLSASSVGVRGFILK